ncbi:MAG TPA: hypothetical protein VMU39_16685 [Solirubrobacteraceae bacterium]|nr:hypothetical protein [Solirubrobacteraceae bacterium]
MPHGTLIAIVLTCAIGYTMLFAGLTKRTLRLGDRGRCPRCGRVRTFCRCR